MFKGLGLLKKMELSKANLQTAFIDSPVFICFFEAHFVKNSHVFYLLLLLKYPVNKSIVLVFLYQYVVFVLYTTTTGGNE